MGIVTIKQDVSRLSVKDRAELAHWIIENLESVTDDQGVVDAAWSKEVRQRVEDIQSGKVRMITAEKVWEDIQERINFISGIRKGLRELDEGKGISHEEIKEEFKELLENLSDLAVATERRDEPTIAHKKVMEELKRDGCLL